MADFSKFRSAINGFNRTDVVNYVESISLDYQKQLRQLQAEIEQLHTDNQSLLQERDVLTAKTGRLETELRAAEEARQNAETELAALREQAEQTPPEPEAETQPDELDAAEPEGAEMPDPGEELAAYRRAAQTERNAATRAKRLQARVTALCDNARSRYQDTSEEITALSEDLSVGIVRLQDALSELQQIFDQSEEAFEALELPEEE